MMNIIEEFILGLDIMTPFGFIVDVRAVLSIENEET